MRQSDDKNQPFRKYHDQQISSDKHDEITLWLYNEINNVDLLEVLRPKVLAEGLKVVPTHYRPILEYRLGDGKYTAGFVDLAVDFTFDIEYKDGSHMDYKQMTMIEVKTSVNIGETIRQINYYRPFAPNAQWFVCAPPFANVSILNDQGIGFIEYKP